MSKPNSSIKLQNSYLYATKYDNEVEICDENDGRNVYVTKQDLLDMLKLFEEQEQENM